MPPDREAGRAEVLAAVSRETAERLDILVVELKRWQAIRNLVAKSTLPVLWTRHIADSLQLATLGGDGASWIDVGSGGGFPGLVVAAARPDLALHLVESDARKCAFLRHAARAAGLAVRVHEGRADAVLPRLDRADTLSARAVAELSDLLAMGESMLMKGAVGLFPKGRGYAAELTRAEQGWRFTADVLPSRTDPEARILRIRDFAGRRIPPLPASPT
jgi:16S rRNA (guanine527-N7)-methyltransferase